MFTGLVQDVGTVAARKGCRLTIATALPGLALGDSVACAGCCLTVVEVGAGAFVVEVSPETLARTHIGAWGPGTKVNLESALCAGDPMGGHIVTGHIDGLARLLSVEEEGEFRRMAFAAPADLAPLIAPKGSLALDGVSLTVNGVDGPRFDVMIIPHTWENTTLSLLRPGDPVHIEADILARYAARAVAAMTPRGG